MFCCYISYSIFNERWIAPQSYRSWSDQSEILGPKVEAGQYVSHGLFLWNTGETLLLWLGVIYICSRLSIILYFYHVESLLFVFNHCRQPIPNPFTRYFHFMPKAWHRFEVWSNHFAELVAPFLLLMPLRSLSLAGGLIQIMFQLIFISSCFQSCCYVGCYYTYDAHISCFDTHQSISYTSM